ncbi:transporter substrate-binding domain-containing protein [Thermodesulfobacteriota bacterium]
MPPINSSKKTHDHPPGNLLLSYGHILLAQLILIVTILSSGHTPVLADRHHDQPQTLRSASELDYPPFAVVRPDGTADGFSVDLLRAVVKAVDLEINISVGPWHEIKQQLSEGRLDVLPLVAYSPDRDQIYDFTTPYLHMHGTLFVRKGEKSIRSEADLEGKEVLVMRDDSSHEYAVTHHLPAKLILTTSFEEAMRLLSSGKHDAVLCQYLVGLQLIKKLGIKNVVSVSSWQIGSHKPGSERVSGFEQKFCIAVPEGRKELLSHLNEGLALVVADGTYQKLYNKWFGPILPKPDVPLTTVIKSVLLFLVPILFFVAVAGIWYLKREIHRKTRSLRIEIRERKLAEEKLNQTAHDLKERVKELNCMFGISKLVEKKDITTEEILRGTVNLIPPSWQYPEITCARITIREQEYITQNFNDTVWRLASDIFVNGNRIGSIEVCYLEERPEKDEGPFLHEERALINAIAERLGKTFKHIETELESAQAKEALHTASTFLQSVIDGVTETIIVIDTEYRIIMSNKAAQELFFGDFSAEAPFCYQITHKQDEPCSGGDHPCSLKEVLKTKKPYTVIHNHIKKDGVKYPVELLASPIFDEHGEVTGIIEVGRDISERLKIEEERKKLETSLFQQQKDQSIATLAGGIAHDFNNILKE